MIVESWGKWKENRKWKIMYEEETISLFVLCNFLSQDTLHFCHFAGARIFSNGICLSIICPIDFLEKEETLPISFRGRAKGGEIVQSCKDKTTIFTPYRKISPKNSQNK